MYDIDFKGANSYIKWARLKQKNQLLYEAMEAAKYALELDDQHWAAHKWVGILLGDIGEIEGTQKLLELSPEIKYHFEKSISLYPDPTTIYCLGVWHFKFAELLWYKRKAAEIYFGVGVPNSTYQTALGTL